MPQNQENTFIFNTPVGDLAMTERDNALVRVELARKEHKKKKQGKETPFLKKAALELGQYFEGKKKSFTINISFEGTIFQNKVWKALLSIPYGQTRSYKQIAQAVGNPKASRAVGNANNKNPLMIIVPCHRVVQADGSLGGYACGLRNKKFLLDLELKNK